MMVTWEWDLKLTGKLYRDEANVVNHLYNSNLASQYLNLQNMDLIGKIQSIKNADRKKASRQGL